MTRMDCVTSLCSIVAEQCSVASMLLESLSLEKTALAGRDSQALADAANRKQTALAAIERLEVERRRLTQTLGHGASAEDMTQLIARVGVEFPNARPVVELTAAWSSLGSTLRRCRESNATNGRVVASLQRRVQQALNLLRGGRGEVATYGRTGSTQLAGVSARAWARV
ncbi:MAG: flagella synthesis protein FlgN [Dehalococcoidia bacterium]